MTFLTDTLIIDGARIAYRDNGTGEPIVFIHGTPSHSHEWRKVVPQVEKHGYRTITYDLLGYGLSERPIHDDTSVAAQTKLLERILAELDINQATIVAHDIGGAVGLRFALAHPHCVRRLMLLDTVSYNSWPSETWRQIIDNHLNDYLTLTQEDFNAMLTNQLRMTVEDTHLMSGESLEMYLAPHQSTLGRVSFFEHQVRHYDSKYTQEIAQQLGAIEVPVHIVWGAKDQWQPVSYAHRLHADIPNSTLQIIPRAGHFVMEDAPKCVVEQVTKFLDE